MSDERWDKLVQELKQHRDEMRLKMHLAKADAKDEWERLEQRWEVFEDKMDDKMDGVEDVAEAASDKIEDAMERAADEIKKGYKRLRDLLD